MRIGILGGGQLSRMLALAGIPLGLDFVFYDPVYSDCVKYLGEVYNSNYDDFDTINKFISDVDVITYENENIPIDTIKYINERKTLHPSMQAIQLMQDRLLEKNFLNSLQIPTADYDVVNSKEDLISVAQKFTFPFILKKRTNSYDGKGQFLIRNDNDLFSVGDIECRDCIVESFVNYTREISLIGCRDNQGMFRFYDICENVHKNGILQNTINKPNDTKTQTAKNYLTNIMNELNYVGVCTIELFDTSNQLIANELAPRVHNSGHWTIEGAVISQFENHLRALLGFTLGDTVSTGSFLMSNIIGQLPDINSTLSQPDIHFHNYAKQPRAGRKLGHTTVRK